MPSIAALERESGIGRSIILPFLLGKLPNNHPALSRLAVALKTSEAALARCMTGAPWPPKTVNQVAGQIATREAKKSPKGKPKNAVVLSKAAPLTEGRRNSLKRGKDDLRIAVRTYVGSVNMAAMAGHTHLPPMPVPLAHKLLTDYLQEKGLEGLLVRPDFAEVFD